MRALFVSTLLVAGAGVAHAEDWSDVGSEPQPTHDAKESTESGNFLPFAVTPKTPASHAQMVGGYDTARGGALVETDVEAKLHEKVQVTFSGSYEGPSGSFSPKVVGQLSLLDEEKQGVDLSVYGGWEKQGFNGVPAVIGRVAVGRHVAGSYLVASTAMGFGTSDGERYGEVNLAGVHHVFDRLYAGIDSRLRMDLQHDTDPSDEDAWAVQAGPVASYAAGPVAITASAGVSARRRHTVATDDVGAITLLGVGAVF